MFGAVFSLSEQIIWPARAISKSTTVSYSICPVIATHPIFFCTKFIHSIYRHNMLNSCLEPLS
jgi:hypothetical protein